MTNVAGTGAILGCIIEFSCQIELGGWLIVSFFWEGGIFSPLFIWRYIKKNYAADHVRYDLDLVDGLGKDKMVANLDLF